MAKSAKQIQIDQSIINVKDLAEQVRLNMAQLEDGITSDINGIKLSREKIKELQDAIESTSKEAVKAQTALYNTLSQIYNLSLQTKKFTPFKIDGAEILSTDMLKDVMDGLKSQISEFQKQAEGLIIKTSEKPITVSLQRKFKIEDTTDAVKQLYTQLTTQLANQLNQLGGTDIASTGGILNWSEFNKKLLESYKGTDTLGKEWEYESSMVKEDLSKVFYDIADLIPDSEGGKKNDTLGVYNTLNALKQLASESDEISGLLGASFSKLYQTFQEFLDDVSVDAKGNPTIEIDKSIGKVLNTVNHYYDTLNIQQQSTPAQAITKQSEQTTEATNQAVQANNESAEKLKSSVGKIANAVEGAGSTAVETGVSPVAQAITQQTEQTAEAVNQAVQANNESAEQVTKSNEALANVNAVSGVDTTAQENKLAEAANQAKESAEQIKQATEEISNVQTPTQAQTPVGSATQQIENDNAKLHEQVEVTKENVDELTGALNKLSSISQSIPNAKTLPTSLEVNDNGEVEEYFWGIRSILNKIASATGTASGIVKSDASIENIRKAYDTINEYFATTKQIDNSIKTVVKNVPESEDTEGIIHEYSKHIKSISKEIQNEYESVKMYMTDYLTKQSGYVAQSDSSNLTRRIESATEYIKNNIHPKVQEYVNALQSGAVTDDQKAGFEKTLQEYQDLLYLTEKMKLVEQQGKKKPLTSAFKDTAELIKQAKELEAAKPAEKPAVQDNAVEQIKQENEQLKEQVNERQKLAESLSQANKELQTENTKLQTEKAELQNEAQKSADKIDQQRYTIENLKDKNEQLQEQIEERRTLVHELMDENQKLKEAEKAKEETPQPDPNIEQIKADNQKLKEENEKKQQEIEKLNELNKKATEAINNQTQQLSQAPSSGGSVPPGGPTPPNGGTTLFFSADPSNLENVLEDIRKFFNEADPIKLRFTKDDQTVNTIISEIQTIVGNSTFEIKNVKAGDKIDTSSIIREINNAINRGKYDISQITAQAQTQTQNIANNTQGVDFSGFVLTKDQIARITDLGKALGDLSVGIGKYKDKKDKLGDKLTFPELDVNNLTAKVNELSQAKEALKDLNLTLSSIASSIKYLDEVNKFAQKVTGASKNQGGTVQGGKSSKTSKDTPVTQMIANAEKEQAKIEKLFLGADKTINTINDRQQASATLSVVAKNNIDVLSEEFKGKISELKQEEKTYEELSQSVAEIIQQYKTKTNELLNVDKLISSASKKINIINSEQQASATLSMSAKNDIDVLSREFEGKISELRQDEKTYSQLAQEVSQIMQEYNTKKNEILNSNNIITKGERALESTYKSIESGRLIKDGDIEESLSKIETIISQVKQGSININDASAQMEAALNKLSETVSLKNIQFNESKNLSRLSGMIKNVDKMLSKGRLNFTNETGRDMIALREKMQAIYDSGTVTAQINNELNTQFNNLSAQAARLGLTGTSEFKKWTTSIQSSMRMVFGGNLVYRFMSQIRQIPNVVKQIDTEMTNLKRVTTATSAEYDAFLKNAVSDAQKLGTTINNVVQATASFARLGYNLKDASVLGEVAQIYSNVGWLDIKTATDDIVSVMKAFNIEAENSINIVDTLDTLGNKFALTSADVGSGLRASASALATANNSFEESAAMITAITEITQDSQSAGNALKTLSLRIRSTKAQLEELGEDTEGAVTTTAKLRKQIKGLTGVDIIGENGEFKSTYEIMKGIAAVWNDITDTEQAALLEQLAGKTRANQVAALLNNWSQAEKALDESLNSSGAALKENETYLRSAEGRLSQLKASAQELALEVFNSDDLKAAFKVATDFIESLSNNREGIVAAASAIVGIFTAIRNPGSNLGSIAAGSIARIPTVVKNEKVDLSGLFNQVSAARTNAQYQNNDTALQVYTESLVAAEAANQKWSASQQKVIVQNLLQSKSIDKTITNTRQLASETNKLSIAEGLAAVKGTLLATALNTVISMGIGLAISLVTSAITEVIQKNEKLAESALNSADALKEEIETIDDAKKKIQELTEELRSGNLTHSEAYEKRKEIISIQDELVDKYGVEKVAVDNLNSSLDTYIANMEKAKTEDYRDWLNMNGTAITNANKILGRNDEQPDKFSLFSRSWGSAWSSIFGRSGSETYEVWLNTTNESVKNTIEEYAQKAGLLFEKAAFDVGVIGDYYNLDNTVKSYKKFLDGTKDDEAFVENEELKTFRDRVATAYKNLTESDDYKVAVNTLKEQAKAIVETTPDLKQAETEMEQAVTDYQNAALENSVEAMKTARSKILQIYEQHQEDFADEYIKAIFDGISNVVLEDAEGTKLTVEDEIAKAGGKDIVQAFAKGKNRSDILEWYQLLEDGGAPLSSYSVDSVAVFNTLNTVLEATGLSIEDVVDAFVKLNWVEEDFSKKVSKATPFATIIKETEDAAKALGNFDSAISKMSITNDNSVLTADELNTLVGYDTTLVNEVERTADGYLIAADKLVEARQKYYKAQKENLQTEIDDAQTELDEMQATLKKLEATPEDKREATYTDDVKQTKENIKTLEQNISSYRLALLELQAPTTDFRTSLGDITSKAESLSSSLVTMQHEEEKLGAISSDTAVEFIANNKNWEDFLELTDKGTFKLKASADGYEELIKQSSGYNDVMAKLKTQQSQQNDRFLELQSSLQSGKGDVKSLVDEITNCYEEMGNTEEQIKTLDDLFQKFFSHLEASEAVQNFTDNVNDLNHKLNLGEITTKQRTAEYEELIEGLRTAAANGDKNAQNELESAEETLYNYRITDMTEEADDAFDALNRSYDRGNKNLQAKLNNYKSIVEKYYAPGTLLGDTEDGQEKYLSYLDEVYSMQNQIYENDYSTRKKAIDRLYEDSEVTVDAIDDKIKAYTQLNEEFYNPDTGKLGKTREAIDSETYIENQREIQNLQHEAYEKHEAEAERIKNISGNTAEAVKIYWNSVMTYAKQYLADIPQYQDELQEIIDNYNSTGQKEMHDADLDALQRRNDLGLISDKEYWQSRYALAEKYYKNNEALVEDWQSEEQSYLTEGMQDMYNEETKLSQQAYDKGEINLGTHLENMIAAWKTYYKDKAELRDEDLQAQQDIYDETISAYNDQKSALEKQKELIEKPYNDEIDKLNESKEEFDRVVDNKINKLNEQKSALEKVNSQIQHQTDLIKAQNDLEKAKRNTRLIYTGSGWDTQRDEAAYQDALSNYEQAKNTSEADAMQQQIDALNDTKDKIDTWYNDEIQAHKDEMKLATKEVDCLIGLLDYVTGKMEMGRIDPSLIATVATSDYGKDYFDYYNKLEKYYDNTNRGVESQFSDLFGNFQKINGISKNMGISDSTLTEYASLFNYLGNLTGGKANAYTGITTDKTNGYFSSSDAKRAYIQLYGSKKYDPTTDTIDMKLSDGVFMTSDGAILVAEELAKSNKTTSEQLAAGYKKDWDKTTTETKNTADGLSTKDLLTMFTGISQVFSDSDTLDKLNQKVQENQKKQLDNAATKVTTPDTILTKPPTFNITIEGNTDENTVSQIRTELTSAFNEYTDLFTTKLYTYYQRQATTQAAT